MTRPSASPSVVVIGWVVLAASAGAVVTSLPYLFVLGGVAVPVPVGLPAVDAAHVGSGSLVAWYLVAKARRVGTRLQVPGLRGVAPWQRWLSALLAAAVTGVVGSGVAALAPVSPPVHADLAQVHLMLTGWTAGLVLLHLGGHRKRLLGRRPEGAGPKLADRGRAGHRRAPRWAAPVLLVVAVPVVLGAALPAAGSAPARQGADARWSPAGPAVFTDALAADAPEGLLLAGGAGLYVRPLVARPGPRGDAVRAGSGAWHEVGPFGPLRIVLSVLVVPALRSGSERVLVGAADGLYGAPSAWGPFRRLTGSVTAVHGIAVDAGGALWCAGAGGVARSGDGGVSFRTEDAGLLAPDTAWALAFFHGALFASDAVAVYRWDGASWRVSSRMPDVVALDAPRRHLTASSMGAGIAVLTSTGWRPADAGLVRHDHGPARGVHVVGVTAVAGGAEVAGTMTAGAAVSSDGRTWMPLWPQLGADGVLWRVLAVGDDYVAATDEGVVAAPVPWRPAAPGWWWAAITAAASAGGLAGAAALWPRRRPNRAR